MSAIEALYIFDEHNSPILEHVYRSRPPVPRSLLPLYLAHPAPRPSLLYLPDASPPTTVFSIIHSNLLFLSPSTVEVEPLIVLEFLHRVVDVLEDFLGAPLLASKIESSYDIIAQLVGEMCDAGVVTSTEPNALRENVDVPGWMGKLLGGVGLPSASPALKPSGALKQNLSFNPSTSNAGPAIPWRRQGVKHTSNELYVDIIENLSVTIAPSGRPLAAIVSGSIAFTAKISGVPDLLLTLSAPGGISRTLELPVFHPCVRLARWRERPGELSFVPPDGRFVLAGYEVDLLPLAPDDDKPPSHTEKLFLPTSVDLQNSLGTNGADFEVRLTLSTNFPGASSSSRPGTTSRYSGTVTPSFLSGVGSNSGSSSAPTLEELIVTVPIPPTVRNLTDLRPSRGEAHFMPGDQAVEWRVPTKDASSAAGTATLRCTVVGPLSEEDVEEASDELGVNNTINPLIGYYDESSASEPYQSASTSTVIPSAPQSGPQSAPRTSQRKIQLNTALMPTSVSVSFSVKGWLPSGIRVEGLVIDSRKSKGLGEGVRPYKGVKYLCVSQKGVERRV